MGRGTTSVGAARQRHRARGDSGFRCKRRELPRGTGERFDHVWGADIDGSSDDSPAFDFAASGGQALLVWDDYSREQGRGTIRATLLGANGQVVRESSSLSPSESDVESPRLVSRQGGYWLAWLRVKWQPPKPAQLGHSNGLDVVDPEQPVLSPKARWIEVVPLDSTGVVAGEPLRISPEQAMVQGYDLQAGHEGDCS